MSNSDTGISENAGGRARNEFGGGWTLQKLEVLKEYLSTYTTVLKKAHFKLMYVDAFAGCGKVDYASTERGNTDQESVEGSVRIALNVKDKPFDKFIFIEKNRDRYGELEKLKEEYPDKQIHIELGEANAFIQNIHEDWKKWRGVILLDPFATSVEWATVEKIASLHALDTWILFPLSAIARILPTSRKPEDVDPAWAERLTKIYGGRDWERLYTARSLPLFPDDSLMGRDPGTAGLLSIYKSKLREAFGKRFLEESITLRTSQKSPLFEFLFCVGHERGIPLAKRIAKHIIEHSA